MPVTFKEQIRQMSVMKSFHLPATQKDGNVDLGFGV